MKCLKFGRLTGQFRRSSGKSGEIWVKSAIGVSDIIGISTNNVIRPCDLLANHVWNRCINNCNFYASMYFIGKIKFSHQVNPIILEQPSFQTWARYGGIEPMGNSFFLNKVNNGERITLTRHWAPTEMKGGGDKKWWFGETVGITSQAERWWPIIEVITYKVLVQGLLY